MNPWVSEHRGDHSPLVRISPMLYPQRKLLNLFFLPKLRDLPQEDMDLRGVVFDFGYVDATKQLQAFDTQYVQDVMQRNFMMWGATMRASTEAAPAVPVLGSIFQLYHTHEGVQRQFSNKWMTDVESTGTARRLFTVTHPYLFLKQDTIPCEMKNTSAKILNAQLVLWGAEFD